MTEKPKESSNTHSEKRTDDTIYVGKKGVMSYVLAVVTKLNQTEKAVKVKARGKAINRAVDVVEIVRNKFIKDVKIQGIELSTEEVKTEDGNTLRVSSMEVTLTK